MPVLRPTSVWQRDRGAVNIRTLTDRSFLDIVSDSSIPFLEVPEMDSRKPSTSFKARGQPLKVDLLVPGNPARGFILGKEHVVPAAPESK
ncbi:hypothetical protein WQE_34621 [Paraburkholderia hospita]|uniref:Uncharacterized protein n=1 Tax=Paraburkholderia hospita TaxID=169430 RepID=A0ABN0FCE4_9BURK|nr:hypothetical protein WQE_34621 [Paraburkholderia hospita]